MPLDPVSDSRLGWIRLDVRVCFGVAETDGSARRGGCDHFAYFSGNEGGGSAGAACKFEDGLLDGDEDQGRQGAALRDACRERELGRCVLVAEGHNLPCLSRGLHVPNDVDQGFGRADATQAEFDGAELDRVEAFAVIEQHREEGVIRHRRRVFEDRCCA